MSETPLPIAQGRSSIVNMAAPREYVIANRAASSGDFHSCHITSQQFHDAFVL